MSQKCQVVGSGASQGGSFSRIRFYPAIWCDLPIGAWRCGRLVLLLITYCCSNCYSSCNDSKNPQLVSVPTKLPLISTKPNEIKAKWKVTTQNIQNPSESKQSKAHEMHGCSQCIVPLVEELSDYTTLLHSRLLRWPAVAASFHPSPAPNRRCPEIGANCMARFRPLQSLKGFKPAWWCLAFRFIFICLLALHTWKASASFTNFAKQHAEEYAKNYPRFRHR